MTPVETPSLALIGCGSVAAHYLLPALLRIGWQPTILVDRSRPHCEKLLAQLDPRAPVTIANDWTDVEGQFDAAIVATPSVTHGPIGNALAERGIHLFIEKPLAHTLTQAEKMVARADLRGSVLAVGLRRRHLTISRWTKALIASGTLGRVERFEAREGFVYNWAVSSPDMLRPGTVGDGVLMDTGAHALDLLLWWLGDALEVNYQDHSRHGVEADCRLRMKMESGAIGFLELSRSRNLRNTVRILGTKGHVEVRLHANEVVSASPEVMDFTHDGISPRTMQPQILADLFEAELRDFLKAVMQHGTPTVEGRESLRSIALIERCSGGRGPFLHGRAAAATSFSDLIDWGLVERLCLDYAERIHCIVRDLAQSTPVGDGRRAPEGRLNLPPLQ
jgi:predicted dehydrogenase